MTVVADTGAMYALVDRSDDWHEWVTSWWTARPRDVLVPVTTLPEITYLLRCRIGVRAEIAFVRSFGDGELQWIGLDQADVRRAAELTETYGDTPLGFVDASVVAIAERLGAVTILTTDRRHFSVVRPTHAPAFELVP
ncbi:MAG: type II toxin-antitoxin system VapC family toxin [Gemmatimonadales bacterium]